MIVHEYVEHYSDYRDTGGSVDLRGSRLVTNQTGVRCPECGASTKRGGRRRVTLARLDSQSYKGNQFVDLRDFCARAQKQFAGDAVYDACSVVINALDGIKAVDGSESQPRCIIRSGYRRGLSALMRAVDLFSDGRGVARLREAVPSRRQLERRVVFLSWLAAVPEGPDRETTRLTIRHPADASAAG